MMAPTFLHIAPDALFIDDAHSFYEELGGHHRWLSLKENTANNSINPFSFIKNKYIEPVSFTRLCYIVTEGSYDAIVFHFLSVDLYPVVLKVPEKRIIIWSSWGGDIYCNFGLFNSLLNVSLYKDLTFKSFYSDKKISKDIIKQKVLDFIKPSRVHKRKDQLRLVEQEKERCSILQKEAISRIDLCSTVLETEYKELKQIPFFKASYYPFKYVTKKDDHHTQSFYGDSILVGNSRDPSNNHLDVLNQLDKIGIKNRIILPLAYGEPKTLDILRNKYEKDSRFMFLTKFIDRDEYFKTLQQCKVAIFGHIRQQALGNINYCLRQGSKVFFYKDSFVYKFYREKGVNIYSIENDLTNKSIEESLSLAEVNHNRSIINDLWSYDNVLIKSKQSLNSCGLNL